jgi:hypothetical protein
VAVGAVAEVDVARRPALDPVGQRDGFGGDRIEVEARVGVWSHAVALVRVVEEHGLLGLSAVHHDVWISVDVDRAGDSSPPKSGCRDLVGPMKLMNAAD